MVLVAAHAEPIVHLFGALPHIVQLQVGILAVENALVADLSRNLLEDLLSRTKWVQVHRQNPIGEGLPFLESADDTLGQTGIAYSWLTPNGAQPAISVQQPFDCIEEVPRPSHDLVGLESFQFHPECRRLVHVLD